jgi:hypothetical protein
LKKKKPKNTTFATSTATTTSRRVGPSAAVQVDQDDRVDDGRQVRHVGGDLQQLGRQRLMDDDPDQHDERPGQCAQPENEREQPGVVLGDSAP